MKTKLILLMSLILPGAQSFAADHPCKQIVKACEAAGFVKGGHKEKKGLWVDCVKPVKAGQSVTGVSVDPSVVQACVAKKAAKAAATATKGTAQ